MKQHSYFVAAEVNNTETTETETFLGSQSQFFCLHQEESLKASMSSTSLSHLPLKRKKTSRPEAPSLWQTIASSFNLITLCRFSYIYFCGYLLFTRSELVSICDQTIFFFSLFTFLKTKST